jgi:hypothetical protein
LPSTGAAGLTETGGGGHLIGARLGETVLTDAGLFTDVKLLDNGELAATSEVLARDELPQAHNARAKTAVPSGVACKASLPFVPDAFVTP